MIHPLLDVLVDKVDNRYTLAILAAKRARQIVDGSEPFVSCESKKPVTIALEEIAQKEITYLRTKINILK